MRKIYILTVLTIMLFGCSKSNVPTTTGREPSNTSIVVTSSPLKVETEVIVDENGVLIMAEKFLGRPLSREDDLALYVEGIPGGTCGTTLCAAEIYINSSAILQSRLLGSNVRRPKGRLIWGTSAEILALAQKQGLLGWREGKAPHSALFIGWTDDKGINHLGATGWNWFPTEWVGANPSSLISLDEEEFWRRVDSQIQ